MTEANQELEENKIEKIKTIFEKLYTINVNDNVEKKKTGSTELKYLSWAWAWKIIKTECPDASYEILKFKDNLPYVYDENTGYMVFTKMTIEGDTKEMWLPVMDGANKAMKSQPYEYKTKFDTKKVEGATMFDINKTLMRCLVKNMSMFGLGLYIYAGEDLPEGEETNPTPNADDPITNDQKRTLNDLEINLEGINKYNVKNNKPEIEKIEDLTFKETAIIIEMKRQIIKKRKEKEEAINKAEQDLINTTN